MGEKRHTQLFFSLLQSTEGFQRARKDIHNCLCLCYSQLSVSVGEKRHTQLLVSLLKSTEGFKGREKTYTIACVFVTVN